MLASALLTLSSGSGSGVVELTWPPNSMLVPGWIVEFAGYNPSNDDGLSGGDIADEEA